MSEITIPKSSFDIFNKILRAYHAFTINEALSVKNLSSKSNYSNSQIAKSNAFLLELKIIEKTDIGYKITAKGIEFVDTMKSGDKESAMKIFKEILEEYSFTKDLLKYLEFNPQPTREDIKDLFVERANANLEISDHRTGINGLIDMYRETGILNFELSKSEKEAKKKEPRKDKTTSKITKKDNEDVSGEYQAHKVQLNININLSIDEINKENIIKIRNFIKSIKEKKNN